MSLFARLVLVVVLCAAGDAFAFAPLRHGDVVVTRAGEVAPESAIQASAAQVSPQHPFYVRDEGWVEAQDLQVGDLIPSSHGGWVRVGGSTWAQETAVVYNFEVAEAHTYFVGESGAWVHNSGAGCPIDAARIIGEIPWSSRRLSAAINALQKGATKVVLKGRAEAEELFLGHFQGKGLRNVTGMSPKSSKNLFDTKKGTYHWDEGGKAFPHDQDHLQVHDAVGKVIRIYF